MIVIQDPSIRLSIMQELYKVAKIGLRYAKYGLLSNF